MQRGPSGVADQSNARIRAPISPRPVNTDSINCVLLRFHRGSLVRLTLYLKPMPITVTAPPGIVAASSAAQSLSRPPPGAKPVGSDKPVRTPGRGHSERYLRRAWHATRKSFCRHRQLGCWMAQECLWFLWAKTGLRNVEAAMGAFADCPGSRQKALDKAHHLLYT
jgi:hypothetical protein